MRVHLQGRTFRLMETMRFTTSEGVMVAVPRGFQSDGASVPRLLWSILPPFGPWTRAAVLHDYLTRRHAVGDPHEAADSRAKCDRLFRECLRQDGVGKWTAWVMFAGVRTASTLFGWSRMGNAKGRDPMDLIP